LPTYSYACTSCGHDFDQYQTFTDNSLTVCPSCGESTLRKVFNNIGVSFNGSGFYRTDSRSESGAKEKSSDAAPAKKAADSSPSTPTPAAAPSTASASSSSPA
jgi:putative FmdB family regulatory protein